MLRLIRWLKGYVIFTAAGGFSERFLNLCKVHGVNLWNVKCDGENVSAVTTAVDFLRIDIPLENSGMAVENVKKCGLKVFLNQHKWRSGLLIGLVIALLFMGIMSGFIWEVELVGNNGTINEEDFLEDLSELGVKIGGRKSKIDIQSVQRELLLKHKELLWVSLNIFGGKAQIEMSIVVPEEEISDTETPANIVAKKVGKITLVQGFFGTNEVREGDYVNEGDLLISGVCQNADGSESLTHAKGKVFAETENVLTGEYCRDNLQITTENKSRYKLYLFGLELPLWVKPKGAAQTRTEIFLKSKNATLPIGVIREDCISQNNNTFNLSQEESTLFSMLQVIEEKRENYSDAQYIKVEYSTAKSTGSTKVISKITCVEDIGKEEYFTVEEN
ncbi:MAG: sporulation protein YqfD [Oscillospiraceae bacterium]|nr:sporulation protein YqfD [Oscillospiraceae bacterium]